MPTRRTGRQTPRTPGDVAPAPGLIGIGLGGGAKPGDRITAAEWNAVKKMAERGSRPIRVAENSGLTLRDEPRGVTIGTDVRLRKPKAATPTGVRYAYVVETLLDRRPEEVLVQFLSPKTEVFGEPPNEVTRTRWFDDGDPRVAIVPPNFRATDFQLLMNNATQFEVTTPVIKCDLVGDDWVIVYVPRWSIVEMNELGNIVRCP